MPDVTTCSVCNRAVYTTDVDAHGACVLCGSGDGACNGSTIPPGESAPAPVPTTSRKKAEKAEDQA